MSLDGFIATEKDDISWLSLVEKEGEDYGYVEFTSQIDTYIVGRKTYEKVLGMINDFPQAKQYDCYVLSRQDMAEKEGITFYNGNIVELIDGLKKREGKNIYCDGGGEIVKLLMDHGLIDEYIISIIPTILGNGKRLFKGGTPPQNIKLISSKAFDTGLVQVRYQKTEPC